MFGSDFYEEFFEDEFSDMKKGVKTEEEIERMATKENFTQLQKGVHLLKKGTKVQKESVSVPSYLTFLGSRQPLPIHERTGSKQ